MITATRNNANDTRTSRTTITRKPKWEEKQLCGRFQRLTSDISYEKMWMWLTKGDVWRETESLLSYHSSTKQRHKDQPYQSENRLDAKKKADVGYVVIETKRSIT